MKTNIYTIPLALASLTMIANAEPVVIGEPVEANYLSHKLTVKLKASFEGEEVEKEKSNGDVNFSRKITTQKISNKEILTALAEMDVIPEIKGWSLRLVTDSNAEVTGVFAVKKKNNPRDVTRYFRADTDEPEISSYKGKYDDSKDTCKGSAQEISLGFIAVNMDDLYLEARGILTKNVKWDNDEEFVQSYKFKEVSGFVLSEEEDEGLVTGSVTAGKGTKYTFAKVDER